MSRRFTAPGPRGLRSIAAALTSAFVMAAGAAAAAPFIPSGDDVVLERLPSSLAADRGELDSLSARLRQDPNTVGAALHLATRYAELGRIESDPRYDGYAQAALAPWWSSPAPPAGVLLIRATLSQRRHDFAAALTDLDTLLDGNPRHAQAWLSRASILRTQARYDEAAASCDQLYRIASPLVLSTCVSDVASLRGKAKPAYDRLASILDRSTGEPPGVRSWSSLVLAEIAERLGRDEQAEVLYQRTLASGGRDVAVLSAYADLLLDQRRYGQVRDLLTGETRADGLLLRLALAEKALNGENADRLIEMLRDRFAAARLRGDRVHLREEARFRLHLEADVGAVGLAKQNWDQQREPWDARLLLEAALAAGQPDEAQPVIDWLTRYGVEDVRLASLVARLKVNPS